MINTSVSKARLAAVGVGTAGLLTMAMTSPASAATTATAPVSRIYNAAQNTCLDVSTTGGNFLDTYGHPCTGSTAQAFAFYPVTGAPVGTYAVVSQSTGQCMDQYRFGIRQTTCATPTAPPSNAEWTLQQVGTTGYSYQFVSTSTVGTTSPRCVTVGAAPSGYPGPTFTLAACTAGNTAQTLTLTTAP